MKKILLFIGASALVLSSCNNQKLEQAREAAVQDSLAIESLTAQKDSLMSLVGDINNNLLEINELENIVTSKDFQSESPSQKREVLNNLANIKRELAERECGYQHVASGVGDTYKLEIALQDSVLARCAVDGDIGEVGDDFLPVVHETEVVLVHSGTRPVREDGFPSLSGQFDDVKRVFFLVYE